MQKHSNKQKTVGWLDFTVPCSLFEYQVIMLRLCQLVNIGKPKSVTDLANTMPFAVDVRWMVRDQ